MVTTLSGLLFAWGENSHGELGIGNNEDQDYPKLVYPIQEYVVVAMSAGRSHSAVVTKCGELFTWGHNPDGRLLKDPVIKKSSKTKKYKNHYIPENIKIL